MPSASSCAARRPKRCSCTWRTPRARATTSACASCRAPRASTRRRCRRSPPGAGASRSRTRSAPGGSRRRAREAQADCGAVAFVPGRGGGQRAFLHRLRSGRLHAVRPVRPQPAHRLLGRLPDLLDHGRRIERLHAVPAALAGRDQQGIALAGGLAMETAILRRLPEILLAGTVPPAFAALASPEPLAGILAVALITAWWFLLLPLAFACLIVTVMRR